MLKWIQILVFLGLGLFSLASKAEVIHCASEGYRYNTCSTYGYADMAYLVRQTSSTNCVEGQNWGFENGAIWVDNGCSGDFEVISSDRGGRRGYPGDRWGRRPPRYPGYPDRGYDHYEQISCASNSYRYNTCATRGGGRIVSIQLIRQVSRTTCIYGQNYGATQDYVWVNNGCRGDFQIRMRGGY